MSRASADRDAAAVAAILADLPRPDQCTDEKLALLRRLLNSARGGGR